MTECKNDGPNFIYKFTPPIYIPSIAAMVIYNLAKGEDSLDTEYIPKGYESWDKNQRILFKMQWILDDLKKASKFSMEEIANYFLSLSLIFIDQLSDTTIYPYFEIIENYLNSIASVAIQK